MSNKKIILLAVLVLTFFLNIFGITWGLPSKWCIDEPVTDALKTIAAKSILPMGDGFHPTFHYVILIIFLAPVLLFLKVTGYPLDMVQKAASVSWINLSNVDPVFASLIYIVARISSALFAVLSIYLAYRIAKKIYSEMAGIYSALFLGVTMGFIAETHMSKSTALLIFMILLTVFACINYYDRNTIKKYIVPFFCGGLTFATKYNGGIIIFPLGYYLFKTLTKERQLEEGKIKLFVNTLLLNKNFYVSLTVFLISFLLGFPRIVTNFFDYSKGFNYYRTHYVPQSPVSALPNFISGFLGYFLTLKDIFGMALFFLIIAGIIFSVIKIKPSMPIKIILFMVIPYYIFFSFNPKLFEVKYIIPIVPFLVILSSGIVDNIFKLKYIYKVATSVLLFFIWVISFGYVLACDNIFSRRDIRYEVTDWIEHNIGKEQKLIIIGAAEWVIHYRLFKDYDITLLLNDGSGFNPKYNRHYVGGRQYSVSKEAADKIMEDLTKNHDYFLIYPVFIKTDRICIWKTRKIVLNYGVDIDSQKMLKEFSRVNSFFWNPNLCGYEPEKIMISHGMK